MSSYPPIPLRDFFKNPNKTAFSLSPDGSKIAYLAPYKERMNIHIRTLSSDEEDHRVTHVTDRDIPGFAWANNHRIIYMKDFGGDENFHLFGVGLDGKEEIDLTPFKDARVEIINSLPEDEDHFLVSINNRVPEIYDPFRLNIETGELTLLAENPGNITKWFADHTGKLRLAQSTDGVNNSLLYRETEQDEFQVVLENDFRESIEPMFFSFDNQHVYALSNLGRDKSAVVRLDPTTGKEMEILYEHEDVDVGGLSYSRKRKVLTHVTFTTWKRSYHFLDEARKTLQQKIEKGLENYEVVIVSVNKAEDKFLIRTYSDRSLGAYYFYDANTDERTLISEVSPWIDEQKLAPMKPIKYTSRDGLLIHGYLTLPQNKKHENLPVVINPHGGPWHRDTWTFNPEIQFLANRGYAVLQMNFRGSTGFGRKFWELSFNQWGLKMQDDISDGVQWLIDQGIADPKRVAIYGGSYGGYATLAGITFTPDLYACAIDLVGVSNLFTFMKSIPRYWMPYLKMLKVMVGDPDLPADYERLKATSPVFHVDKIKVPLMIAQGAKDPRVVQSESDQMVEALRKNNIEVEYMLKANEGHGFRNQENRFEFYERMETFLEKHL